MKKLKASLFSLLALTAILVFTSKMTLAEPLRDLYPKIEPYRTGYLKVAAEHTLYFEESGNPNGKPVLFLHGGPGLGTEPKQRRFFDPKVYRIILFDQRGCGKSTPLGLLTDNTIKDLVYDIEVLRAHLKIKEWMVFGGSFGSTLALAYAEAYPKQVTHLILRGILLGSERENLWVSELDGIQRLYPDLWEDYLSLVPAEKRQHIMEYYHELMQNPDPSIRKKAVFEWANYEERLSYEITPPRMKIEEIEDRVVAGTQIEMHYFLNQSFLEPDQLIENVDRIRGIPTIIVHGRHDLLCPLENAHRLHKAWPEAKFVISEGAGHSAYDPPNQDQLIRATDAFRPN